MAGRHHVLLIGIDAYDGGGMLTGCVNDIDAIQRLLIDRAGIMPDRITRLAAPRTGEKHEIDIDVKEAIPTLDNLRAELARLGSSEINEEDSVFIYYSGHGTQCIVADKLGRRFSREALLPKDKVHLNERRFLFDWELNALLTKIAERTAAVTVILDCCSAAGATRDAFDEENTRNRFWPSPNKYQLRPDDIGPQDPIRGVADAVARVPRCLLVAACQDDERARESRQDGGLAYGELTRALLRQFTAFQPVELSDLRWGRIWRAVAADVNRANPRQNPWISGGFGRRVFGFGPDEESDTGFAVNQCGEHYRLDIGTLAGVTGGAEIAVYGASPPTFPPLNSTADHAARKGLLRVERAFRSTCEAMAVVPFILPDGPRGRLCKAGRAARLRVSIVPNNKSLANILASSSLIELAPNSDVDLRLVQRSDGAWALTDDVHGTGELAGVPALAVIPADELDLALPVVEYYHAYLGPVRMARACPDLPSLLRLWLLDCNGLKVGPSEAQAPDIPQVKAGARAPYEIVVGDRLCFVVENSADVGLSVTLIDCAASGRVIILGRKSIPRNSRHVFWCDDILGMPFSASLPKGQSLGVDRVVAIGTTRHDDSLTGFFKRETTFTKLLTRYKDAGRYKCDADIGLPAECWTSALTAIWISRSTT